MEQIESTNKEEIEVETSSIEAKPKRKVNYVFTEKRKEAFEKAKEKRRNNIDGKKKVEDEVRTTIKKRNEDIKNNKKSESLIDKEESPKVIKKKKIVKQVVEQSETDESSSDEEIIIRKKMKPKQANRVLNGKKNIVKKDYSDESDDEKTYDNRQISKVVYV